MAAPNRMLTLSPVEPPSPRTGSTLSLSPALWMAGSSAAMIQLRSQIRRVAPYFRTALLTGEQGCGDEAAAHILHQLSPRAQHPFREIIPTEADLSFDAQWKPEPFALAGMLYLPSPERLSQSTQTALFRLLRERGSQAPRIVAFTERGLAPLVMTGSFSAELADSLGALQIALPSLRERRADIPELLLGMLQDFGAKTALVPPHLAPDLLQAAMKFPWPGNFIQLQAAVQGLMFLASNPVLHAQDLEIVLGEIPQPLSHDRREIRMVSLDEVIQEHIHAVLFACSGNKLHTAEVLGISRSTLYRMLEVKPQSQSISTPAHPLQRTG